VIFVFTGSSILFTIISMSYQKGLKASKNWVCYYFSIVLKKPIQNPIKSFVLIKLCKID